MIKLLIRTKIPLKNNISIIKLILKFCVKFVLYDNYIIDGEMYNYVTLRYSIIHVCDNNIKATKMTI